MKFKGVMICTVACAVIAAFVTGCPPQPYEPEFWVDSHGAGGVTRFLGEYRAFDPSYDAYYFGGLDWLVATAVWQGDMCGWILDPDAEPGDPNYKIITGGSIGELTRGYLASGNTAYRDTALGSLKALLDSAIPDEDNPYGQGYWWGKRVGWSHGPGKVGGTLIDAYDDLPGATALVAPYLQGLCIWLLDQAVWGDDGQGNPTAMWPEEEGGTAYETGYCYGNAGTLAFLISAADHFPTITFPAGSPVNDLRELVNAGLRWLISVAVEVPEAGGVKWLYMRHDQYSENIGWGSGVAGIGGQFGLAYLLNQAAGDPFADVCLEYAKKAAATVVYKIDLVSSIGRGACGGEAGAPLFLFQLADEIEGTEPLLAEEYRETSGKIADFVVADRMTFYNDRAAWRAGTHLHAQAANVAFDYGVTGLGYALYLIGTELSRPDLVEVAGKAAEYIRLITKSAAQGGYKWPKLVPFGPTDTDGDGMFDDWDEYPDDPNRVWD